MQKLIVALLENHHKSDKRLSINNFMKYCHVLWFQSSKDFLYQFTENALKAMQVPTMHIFITLVYWNRKSDLLFLQAMTWTAIMSLLQVVKRWTLQIESYDF